MKIMLDKGTKFTFSIVDKIHGVFVKNKLNEAACSKLDSIQSTKAFDGISVVFRLKGGTYRKLRTY